MTARHQIEKGSCLFYYEKIEKGSCLFYYITSIYYTTYMPRPIRIEYPGAFQPVTTNIYGDLSTEKK